MGRPATPIGKHGRITFESQGSGHSKRVIARAHFRDSDGVNRPVTATGRTETTAQNALLAKLAERTNRNGLGNVQPTTRIADLVGLYILALRANTQLKAQTKARYIQSARGAIFRAFPEVAVSELNAGMIESLIVGLVNSGHLSEARNCRVVLRSMMRMAVSSGALRTNPVTAADIRLPVSVKSARALTSVELALLRDLVSSYRTGPGVRGPKQSPDLKEALDVMLGTGLRISEVLAIRTDDVEFLEDGRTTVHVRGTIIYEDGLGAVRQATPKNHKARMLAVAPWVAQLLRDRAARSRSGLLWETHQTAKPYQQQNLLRDLRRIVGDTELAWVTSHTLRKTAGTMIARELGVSAATSALGHSSDAITRRIYIDETTHPTDVSVALASLAPRD